MIEDKLIKLTDLITGSYIYIDATTIYAITPEIRQKITVGTRVHTMNPDRWLYCCQESSETVNNIRLKKIKELNKTGTTEYKEKLSRFEMMDL